MSPRKQDLFVLVILNTSAATSNDGSSPIWKDGRSRGGLVGAQEGERKEERLGGLCGVFDDFPISASEFVTAILWTSSPVIS